MSDEDLITTTEAAALTGRRAGAVRTAIQRGHLPMVRRTELGRPLLKRQAVLEWHRHSGTRQPTARTPSWQRTSEILGEYGPASATELAALLHLDAGNIRKHLAILAAQGAAQRRPDGQWITIAEHASGAA